MPATDGDDILVGSNKKDFIVGLGGDDKISGLDGGDTLYGDSGKGPFGDDELFGNDGDDRLLGYGGADRLLGGKGDDVLFGLDGNDQLSGNLGKDDLYGGAGSDRFVFEKIGDSSTTLSESDIIHDFSEVLDRIDVSKIDAKVGTAGNQAFTFVDDGPFTAPGQISYAPIGQGQTVFVALNTDADQQAEGGFIIAGTPDLSASDFVL